MSPLDEFLDGAAGSPIEKEKKLAAYREHAVNSDEAVARRTVRRR